MPVFHRTSWKTTKGRLRPRTVVAASGGMTATQVRSEVAALQLARDLRRVILIGKVVSAQGRVVRVTWSAGRGQRFADGKFVILARVGGRQ